MLFYRLYLSDYKRYKNNSKRKIIPLFEAILGLNSCLAYTFWWRLLSNVSKRNLLWYIAKIMHIILSRKYGIQLPRQVKIGKGLYLGHGLGIVINPGTKIGNNCNLSQFVSIGTNQNTPATIGDNVYIGPNVCIVEGVHIGNNVTIGAGAVVVKDIPDNATVAGVPAKVLNYNNPGRFIGNKA